MDPIERGTSSVDTTLKASHEAVAEKLCVKQHLSRLDALLKLPSTLQTQIGTGKYRLADKRSHGNASHILSKHSSGFESLSRIEVECNQIMTSMATDLERKLEAWTCNLTRNNYSNIFCPDRLLSVSVPIDYAGNQPKSVSEIFECAGTLLFFRPLPFRRKRKPYRNPRWRFSEKLRWMLVRLCYIVRGILPVLHFEANPSKESESMRFGTAAHEAAY
eukprot:CAMPEP_0172417616 /NCGR_PEP_ID=MMETSP1064-20121228/4153_1 /TAXON_ID=202472 /ORGANISM="Aulacoseira subarctica , Strain CCAP 1002/5" /LENGTH=217 /DNA_ID=CAMNT_0013156081 /DNA_START=354 /DNA_END=1007 /DNA_ORIENTATION=-